MNKSRRNIGLSRVLCMGLTLVFAANAYQCLAQIVYSRVTNGVYFGITPKKDLAEKNSNSTNSISIRFDDQLAMAFFSTNGSARLFIPVDKSRFIRFQMHNESGQTVRKTDVGKAWGRNIDDLPKRPGRSNSSRMVSLEVGSSSSTNSLTPITWGPVIPSASELFVMKEPGLYFLTVEPRTLKLIQETNLPTWQQILFPPVIVKIVKD